MYSKAINIIIITSCPINRDKTVFLIFGVDTFILFFVPKLVS